MYDLAFIMENEILFSYLIFMKGIVDYLIYFKN